MTFVFFGTSRFATLVLDALANHHLTPSLVVAPPDKPAGRGLALLAPATMHWAKSHAIPILQPASLKTPDVENRLRAENADVFIVASYGKIIPDAILAIPAHDTINVHPSLLPRWRGADPIRSAILAGDLKTGVSIMKLDAEMDHGPILAQSETAMNEKTYEDLETELAATGSALLADTLPRWLAGTLTPRAQDHPQATFTKKISPADARIVWNEPAEHVERKIRAFSPRPGAFSLWNKNGTTVRIRILRAIIAVKTPNAAPGTVFIRETSFAVACQDEALRIDRLQLEGKKEMAASDFLRGHPEIAGAILD